MMQLSLQACVCHKPLPLTAWGQYSSKCSHLAEACAQQDVSFFAATRESPQQQRPPQPKDNANLFLENYLSMIF